MDQPLSNCLTPKLLSPLRAQPLVPDPVRLLPQVTAPLQAPGTAFSKGQLTCFLDKESTGLNKQPVPLDTFLNSECI